jgi:predicted dehydrogenase
MRQTFLSPLRIGVLGCANIAKQFVRDVSSSQKVKVVAVASRDGEKARDFAVTQGIERHHGSYDALLADPQIDMVYVPLPNSMHAAWCIRAAEHGKHILCEKPLALGLAEASSMFATARRNGVMLLESYPYWFQPQTASLLELLAGGQDSTIGQVRSMQACFGFTLPNPQTNIRSRPELGGGALLDAGSYPLSLIRLVMGCAPVSVMADATWADSGVDISTMATLIYADGRRAQMSCAMDTANHRRAIIMGSKGTLETEYLNHTGDDHHHPWAYLPSQLRVRKGIAFSIPFEEIKAPTGSGFRFAAEVFAQLIVDRDDAAIERAASASLDIAATLEAIAKSARSGSPVTLAG